MSDIEDKLRSLTFREPPQELRRRILAAPTSRTGWLDWLWPSPLAWGAVAAVWLIAFVSADRPDASAPQKSVAHFTPASRFHQTVELLRTLSKP